MYLPENDLIGFELLYQNLFCDLIQLRLNFWEDMNSTEYDMYIESNGNDVPKMRVIGKKHQTIRETLNIETGLNTLSQSNLNQEFTDSIRLLNLSEKYLSNWIDGNANLDSFQEFKNEIVPNLESFNIATEAAANAYTKEIGYFVYKYPELDTELTANVTDLNELCAAIISIVKSNEPSEPETTLLHDYPGEPLQYNVDSYNDNIKKIQERLIYFGYNIKLDGYFGNQTKNAILAFQKQQGLETDGVVGPLTWNALFENKSPKTAYISIPYVENYSRASNNAYYIYGNTSDNCARITVLASNPAANIHDNYELELYEPGDTTFKYGVREDWDNLGVGENTYTFTAHCEGGQTKTASNTLTYTVTIPTYNYPTYTTPKTSLPTSNCDPNYSGCVPIASDVDCAGGSGNGPAYVQGPVRVIGRDIYGLDRDGDGIGCE